MLEKVICWIIIFLHWPKPQSVYYNLRLKDAVAQIVTQNFA